ncbi:hypothetical protein [Tenacibaculum agarivorans]|uniref:hypothetical protein n=1 Tax=Tenacibaculum agarivorans TaxID=1908389 RepID=UPI00094BAFB5|nr:hypothetical protein [Tenacibaculum agarivorans]
MVNIYRFYSRFNFLLIPFLMMLSLILLSKNISFSSNLALSFIVDFLLVIPLTYAFLIRKKSINKLTIITLFVIGVFTSRTILPHEHQFLLQPIQQVLVPLLEVLVLGFVLLKTITLHKKVKSNTSKDFLGALDNLAKELFPARIANFLVMEIKVFYYAFFKWKSKEFKPNEYSYHKEGSYQGILIGIMLIILIETFVLHMLLVKISVVLAWILSVLSVYTIIQFFALYKSLRFNPVYVDDKNKKLYLFFGFFGKAVIDFKNIDKVQINSKESNEVNHLAFIGKLTGHNVIVQLNQEAAYTSMYGMIKKADNFAIVIDDKKKFVDHLTQKLN